MKLFGTTLNTRTTDETILRAFLHRLAAAEPRIEIVEDVAQADLVCLRVANRKEFEVDVPLAQKVHQKKVVVLDFLEYGTGIPSVPPDTTLTWNSAEYPEHGWPVGALSSWISSMKPVLYYKRELLKKTCWKHMRPIEYINLDLSETMMDSLFGPQPPLVVSKAEFDRRVLDVVHTWGRSNINRAAIHGFIIEKLALGNKLAILHPDHIAQRVVGELPVAPWFLYCASVDTRITFKALMGIQQRSKICLALAGAGHKCFRHGEVPMVSVMAMQENPLQWTHDWVDGQNCIVLPNLPNSQHLYLSAAYEKLNSWLSRDDLYDVYKAGVETWRLYSWPVYLKRLGAEFLGAA